MDCNDFGTQNDQSIIYHKLEMHFLNRGNIIKAIKCFNIVRILRSIESESFLEGKYKRFSY